MAALFACFLPLGPIDAAAASDRWAAHADAVFQNYGGVAHPELGSVTSIAEDSQGFLWIGTQGGVNRWDGYRFRNYKTDLADPHALPDNLVRALHVDRAGRLWVGTSAGGLARYEPDRDDFVTIGAGAGALSHISVRSIADDDTGALWVGTEGGLDRLDPATGVITQFHHSDADAASLPDDGIRAVLVDHQGILWVGTRKGLVRRDPDGRFIAVPLQTPEGKPAWVLSLTEEPDGYLWIGTYNTGAFRLDRATGRAQPLRDLSSEAASLDGATIYGMGMAAPGQIWLGIYDDGVAVVDTATMSIRRLRHDASRPTSLGDNRVLAIYRDRSGLVWVGGYDGFGNYDPTQSAVSTVFGAADSGTGISDTDVTAILSAADGRVWLGLQRNGIDIFDRSGARVAEIRPDQTRPATGLPAGDVKALVQDSDGSIFIGTARGVYRSDQAGQRIARLALPEPLASAPVRALTVIGRKLWIGSPAAGLWVADLDEPATARPIDGTLLSDFRIAVLATNADGKLWVGTYNGLDLLDPVSGVVEHMPTDRWDALALPPGEVTSLLNDRLGRLWVAIRDRGVSILDGSRADGRRRFRRLDAEHALDSNLVLDQLGSVWATTEGGMAVIDPTSLTIRYLRRADGLVIAREWAGSSALDEEGDVLVGGFGGLTAVHPDRVANGWSYRPPVVVSELRIGGRPVIGDQDKLTITPDANSVAAEFAALDYSAPLSNRYAYRLDGYDEAWTETDAQHRLAAYTNLPPGNYTLQLKGSNREGVWSEAPTAFTVRVLPAWWQTIWVKLALALASVLAVLGIVRSRTNYLKLRQRTLEREVAARTTDLVAARRQLEQIAYIDSLTSLPNRRMFADNLDKVLAQARRRGVGFALLLVDLDRFKQTNDTFGHDAGDALLVAAGTRFKEAVREADFVARLGGDEFAIILSESGDPAAIEAVCRRIVESFKDSVWFKGQVMRTSPSIGIALYPDHGQMPEELFKAADLALYEAKHAGRNTWRWHQAAKLGDAAA